MKKIFVAMLALAAATACSNDELVSVNQEAIGFDNAFINNSVRSVETPGYSTAKIFDDFAVYGFVEGASLFNGVKVSKNGSGLDADKYAGQTSTSWKYEGTQYWIAGADYKFYAVAPMTNGGWSVKTGTTPLDSGATLSFTTTNGTQDLLYAPIVERPGALQGNVAVAFTFQHILSKVKFSFKNGYNASAATICVRDIKITNANESGEVALAKTAATWSNQSSSTIEIAFGNATTEETYATDATEANFVNYDYAYDTTVESYYERLLIPGNKEWNISFVVELLVSGQKIDEYEHTAKATIDFQPGHSYDINAEITASNIDPGHAQEPIEFTATMTDWSAAEDKNATINNNTANN